MCLSHFCIFLAKWRCEYFLTKPFQYFFNKVKGTISAVSETAQTLSFSVVEYISCDEHQALKWIDSRFVRCLLRHIRKRRTGCRSNGGTSYFVLCSTKPKNLSMLCLCCVWQFVYVVYDHFSMLCMKNVLCCVWQILITLICLYCVWH